MSFPPPWTPVGRRAGGGLSRGASCSSAVGVYGKISARKAEFQVRGARVTRLIMSGRGGAWEVSLEWRTSRRARRQSAQGRQTAHGSRSLGEARLYFFHSTGKKEPA